MQNPNPYGVIVHDHSARPTDYLYRVSLKCLIRNPAGKVLVVKENGRDWWDLPGGGMDHGEDIRTAIAREMQEEITLIGNFDYKIIAVEDPALLSVQNFWQLRLVFAVEPHNQTFSAGTDSDEVTFRPAEDFKGSNILTEQRIYRYSLL